MPKRSKTSAIHAPSKVNSQLKGIGRRGAVAVSLPEQLRALTLAKRVYFGYDEQEASSDWADAEQLIARHELSRVDVEDEQIVEADGSRYERHSWRSRLEWLLAEHYAVSSYEWHFHLYFVGRSSDIQLATIMGEWIEREVDRLAEHRTRRSTRIELALYCDTLTNKALAHLANTRAEVLSEAVDGEKVGAAYRERLRRVHSLRDRLHPDLVKREAAPPLLPYSPSNTTPPNRRWFPPSDDD